MKILFLIPYPVGESPSQRFRFEQYFDALAASGHTFRIHTFFSAAGWNVLYSKGNSLGKILAVAAGFLRRLRTLLSLGSFDIVFIHREAAPFGPPVFEFLITRVFGKKVIYDFDDAIWMTDKPSEGSFDRMIRWRSKVGTICRWSYKVSCGNEFLCNYASTFNANVVLNPTTIDTGYHKPMPKPAGQPVVVGWTGSHSTLKYLDEIIPALEILDNKFPSITFLVIANSKASIPSLRSVRNITWKKETEIQDLAKIDIGVMPLPNDEWSKGKCGFKALQYMAMEIPAIVSPVGVNSTIIDDDHNGMICTTTEQWVSALEKLVADAQLRKALGIEGRKKVIASYSVLSNTSNFLSMFERSAITAKAIR